MLTTIRFVVKSVIAGLALAFIVVAIKPNLIARLPQAVDLAPATPAASYASAVHTAAPAVINIHASRVVKRRVNPLVDDEFLRRFFNRPDVPKERTQSDLGSGVLLGASGVVVTNHHVVANAEEIHVMLRDGRSARAQVVGVDPDTDLAILRIPLKNLTGIPIGTVDDLAVGDVVLAIGNPFGVGQTVTMGIVSAKGRSRLGINTFEDFIQTDAAINPGNSGGALITAEGKLVGINTAILSDTGQASGIGFAIPVDVAQHVAQQITQFGYVRRGWLGIEVERLTAAEAEKHDAPASTSGVLVNRVLASGPAARAGLKPGDLIVEIDGTPISDPQSAINTISAVSPGSPVRITVLRSGRELDLDVVVSQRPG